MVRYFFALLVFALVGTWIAVADIHAQGNKVVATDLTQVDADYYLMGEYVGYVDGFGEMGLQVVAEGDGQFAARAYRGGLPGNGGDKNHQFTLKGKVDKEVLRLESERFVITFEGVNAEVAGQSDEDRGNLRKMVRRSRTLGRRPPRNARVLFDGKDASSFKNARIKNGLLQIGTEIIPTYRDYQLHLEFLLPYMPYARSQGRANSGVYLQSRYEVQILDSFGLEGKFNECGALYRYIPPDQNMAFPPLTWQTYDITFQAPRYNRAGEKICDARITVLHNGVPVHSRRDLERKTGAGKPEGPIPLPIKLQDHGNPVQFRNIWIVDQTRREATPRNWLTRPIW